ncbi:3-phosphoshikimate 1-carboxyvinyltransferase [Merdimonas faecis]|uniref:3-phosphoshikimate 1-carboxyvinyltransferase n=1 Tax=Merdimonas faecis TaxID=1653435 RepID=UPI00086360DA|nr:3-phosphoshikimate 1-carboxyvinyltransferase [Merdimonas faecis]
MSVKEIKAMGALKGEVQIPGDKSISHRAVMLGSIARGTTEISHFLNGADCLSTIHCFQKMGIEIEQSKDLVLVHGRGLRGLKAPRGILDTGNSGTTTRLICGILSGQNFSSVLSGDDSLNSRPMKRIMDPLNQMGARITSIQDNNCAPLRIEPGTLHGIRYVSPVASAQVKSSVLLAGLYADSPVSVTEPVLSRNHTELMLGSFGADISSELHADGSATASVSPCAELYGQKIQVPGDISSAAYFIAAGLLVPGSRLLVKNVGINPTRAGFLEVCRKMGADIGYLNRQSQGGEETADLLVTPKPLTGTVIEGAVIPSLIDEIPILAVMAAFAEGTTVIRDAAELKVKETNRIQTVTENLLAMGAEIIPTEDGMIIHGTGALKGTQIQSHLDHRIAMAFSVAALAAEGTTTILDSQCVDVSYPGFFAQLMDLSGK